MTVIIILALVALFIGLRLYSVLGERTGHEQQPILKPADPDSLVEPRVSQPSVVPPSPSDAGDMAYLPTAGPGVRAILAADPSFNVAHFLEGAKAAYRMILEAYWKGDLDTMKSHVDGHVLEAFADAVAQRDKEGLKLDNRLVAIEQTLIAEARSSPDRLATRSRLGTCGPSAATSPRAIPTGSWSKPTRKSEDPATGARARLPCLVVSLCDAADAAG